MGRGADVRIVTNLRNRLVDYLEPTDQDKHTAVDSSTYRAVATLRVAMAACIVIVILALEAVVTVVWTSTLQVSMPVMQNTAVAGSTPEMTETPAKMYGGPGQKANPQTQVGPLIVLVVGLVANPGVVEMPAGVWVMEVIGRVGGLLLKANPASVSLAAPLVGGRQIVVGTEAFPAGATEGRVGISGGSGVGVAGIAGPGSSDGKVNINTASAAQLEELPGIGSATATKIIDFREENGAFASIGALKEVPGTSPAKVGIPRDAATV